MARDITDSIDPITGHSTRDLKTVSTTERKSKNITKGNIVNLEKPLKPGGSTEINISWSYALVEENAVRARNGYESFADGNDIFLLAQWYPRVTVFSDYEGWHNKEFVVSKSDSTKRN